MRLTYTDQYEYLYTRNSLGYRCAEFDRIDWSSSIAVFGCSEVFGVSVAEDQTLTHYLSNCTGERCINLGIPGGSNTSISVLADWIYHLFKPSHSIIIWTAPHRYPYYSLRYNRFMEMSPIGYGQPAHEEQQGIYRRFVGSDMLMRKEFESAQRRVKPLCASEYTFLGESWQATRVVSHVKQFGLDGGHSAGFRCRDLARQIDRLERA